MHTKPIDDGTPYTAIDLDTFLTTFLLTLSPQAQHVARDLDGKVWLPVDHARATCQAWEVNTEVKAYRVTRGTDVLIAWLRSRDA